MAMYEVLTLVVVVALAVAATAAIYYGLLGMTGQFFVVRCAACGHLTSSPADQPQASCPHCRHPVLLHPWHSLHPRQRSSELGHAVHFTS